MSREGPKVRVTATIYLPSLLTRQGALGRNGGRTVGRGGRRSAVGARRRHFVLKSPKSGGRESVGGGGCPQSAELTVDWLKRRKNRPAGVIEWKGI